MKLSQILFKLYKDGQNNIKTSGTLLHPMYSNNPYPKKIIHIIKYIYVNENNEKDRNEKLQKYFRNYEMKEYKIQKTHQDENLNNQ